VGEALSGRPDGRTGGDRRGPQALSIEVFRIQHAGAIVKSRYMTIAPHNSNAGISTAASLHLCAGLENLEVLEHMSRDVEWGDAIIDYDWDVSDGTIEVPDEPGLGVRIGRRRHERPFGSNSCPNRVCRLSLALTRAVPRGIYVVGSELSVTETRAVPEDGV
jgi:hypothetical protein